jgi:putative sigma-54 modulation protein
MKVSYTGVQKELPAPVQKKLDAKFAKLSKLLEQRGEKEAHVVITNERHLHSVEITLNFYDHQLVGIGRDGDFFNAMSAAIEKMEKQAVKLRTKWREKHRRNGKPREDGAGEPVEAAREEGAARRRIFRVNHHDERKPMTLEEAMIEMENRDGYLVYRDADRECLSVLVRRKDGHFDLIES